MYKEKLGLQVRYRTRRSYSFCFYSAWLLFLFICWLSASLAMPGVPITPCLHFAQIAMKFISIESCQTSGKGYTFFKRYVWNQDGPEWVPTLVILRLNRAALCVQWSPKENKFAVGSGAKTVCICYYEPENDWWVSKLIRKKHNSSVTSIAWHPNNVLLATASTDGKCRVFATYIKGVDSRDSVTSLSTDAKFGELILQLDLSFSWAFGVKWSPSGNTLAYVGHNSTIYFVDDVGSSASAQTVAFRDLPLRDVLFVSERMVIGVGFDCNPMVFTADKRGIWSFVKFLDERKSTPSSSKYGSQGVLWEKN
ncbi:hypothetical protein AMTR_s00039p00197260 [Amborella trichopoda]|uniref:Arp2/3 complex 41 kDa subunit n=1 Tax=Amborella trichopoda TaxID=13333 RepID=U5CRM6_AMBTC|nr:hypothetical protein AMTR_s00039p00197260 [Amborella trichopoda]